ncbi:response regulator [Paenibacillus tuaregi]|uniref:response regulator n=1 Tax=Paenibacillus tuaregi TaxID=1816681 RepID=UPI000837BBB8|nr:response regulator [Paenibacillus tuaregi]
MYNMMIADGHSNALMDMDWSTEKIGQIHTAFHVQEAQQLLQRHAIHILLLDIKRPFEGGFELLSWVRKQHPAIRIIIYTAQADFFDVQKAMRFGISDYILKTADIRELMASVKRVVREIDKTGSMLTCGIR